VTYFFYLHQNTRLKSQREITRYEEGSYEVGELGGDLGALIDYRCDKSRFWLSARNCQVSSPTSQNLELEQQIRIFYFLEQTNSSIAYKIEIHNS
jgi:hypothetical protein